jgi:hypothetical protein
MTEIYTGCNNLQSVSVFLLIQKGEPLSHRPCTLACFHGGRQNKRADNCVRIIRLLKRTETYLNQPTDNFHYSGAPLSVSTSESSPSRMTGKSCLTVHSY